MYRLRNIFEIFINIVKLLLYTASKQIDFLIVGIKHVNDTTKYML